ncbi:3-hydroxyacyl-CoA dehydrogenase family protein [Robertmurraya sp. P23]|uniref:3-hydroxyacyl-CoA dehydrogenase family protein n=1 Tax=Robertmurraya sp. P23 TaxID=3436931 RepID=UPI003D9787A9
MIRKVGLIIDRLTDCWIVEALAERDYDIILYDPSIEILEQEKRQVEVDLDKRIAKWALTESEKKVILSHIKLETDFHKLQEADFILESIKSQPELKREILLKLDQMVPKEIIIASNSSILSLSNFSEGAKYPERMIGVHFFYNVVEIVPGKDTSTETFETLCQLVKSLDKKDIYVQESPGFVTTRLRLQLMNEAINILSEGIASAEDIDESMKIGLGMKEGPLEMVDGFGLKYILRLMEQLSLELGEQKFTPSPLLQTYIDAGCYGKKNGKGFFEYDENGQRIKQEARLEVIK